MYPMLNGCHSHQALHLYSFNVIKRFRQNRSLLTGGRFNDGLCTTDG